MLRPTAVFAALAIATLVLTACAGVSEPEPEWTEEEAYAAAEETFRGYWALDVFSDDVEDELEVMQYVTGELREHYEGESALDDYDVQARGTSRIVDFRPTTYRTVGTRTVVEANACIDDSELELNVDGSGWEVPRKDPIYGVELTFESVDGVLLIAHFDEMEGEDCSAN